MNGWVVIGCISLAMLATVYVASWIEDGRRELDRLLSDDEGEQS